MRLPPSLCICKRLVGWVYLTRLADRHQGEPTFAFVLETLAFSPQFESRSHLPVPSTCNIACPHCLETALHGLCCLMTLPRCPESLILPLAATAGSAAPYHASTAITPQLDGAGLTMATPAHPIAPQQCNSSARTGRGARRRLQSQATQRPGRHVTPAQVGQSNETVQAAGRKIG